MAASVEQAEAKRQGLGFCFDFAPALTCATTNDQAQYAQTKEGEIGWFGNFCSTRRSRAT
jgi:hypothetical protein